MPEEITPGQILEALNNKADRDLGNLVGNVCLIPQYRKLYEGLLSYNSTITFNEDPLFFDFLIAKHNGLLVLSGAAGSWGSSTADKIKLCGIWGGRDTSGGSQYRQIYTLDIGLNGTVGTVYNYSWGEANTSTHTDVSNVSIVIYGIKLV